MKFSNKAYKYLDLLSRDENYIVPSPEQVIHYLGKQGIPAFDKVIAFQMEYSGLRLTITNKPAASFITRLFSNKEILSNTLIDCLQLNGKYYFYCGHHTTAQFYFVLSQDGEIGIYDNEEDSINPIFSSFDKFIETYAFEDLLARNKKYENPPFYDLLDIHEFNTLVNGCFQHLSASDQYNDWLTTDDITIYKGKWFDKTSFYIHVYGDNKATCELYIQKLKDKKIIA